MADQSSTPQATVQVAPVDLTGGLVPKDTAQVPVVDLSGGLVPKASAPPQAETGVWAGVKRNTVGLVSNLYHALSDPASDREKTDLLNKIRSDNQKYGDNTPEDLATNPSRATLAYHRLIDAPAYYLQNKGHDEQAAAKDLLSKGETGKGVNLYASGLADKTLAAIPMIGPAINSIAERYESGDKSGAATDLAAVLVAENASKIARGTWKAGAKVVETAASKTGTISDAIARKMYQSALKPGPASYTPAEVDSMVRTGLENKIPISESGVRKLDSLVSDLNSKISDTIKAGDTEGATVNKYKVASRLGETAEKFKTQVTPESDLNAVGEAGNEFLRNQPTEIPAAKAQEIKQGTYKQLKAKAYGELKSAAVESQKALARGIKEELAEQFPEIADLNAKESKLLGLDNALETAVNRVRNRNLFSLGGKILLGAGAGAFGGAEGAGAGAGLAVMHEILGDAAIQSRIAIGLSRASKIPFPEALEKVKDYVSAIAPATGATAGAIAAGQAVQRGQDEGAKPDKDIANAQSDQDTAGWHHIQTGENHYLIHPADLAEAQRRDPSLKIHGPQTQ